MPADKEFQPIEFVPVKSVFKAMVKIIPLVDLSGWASREKRQKWGMSAGQTYIIDEDKAREFVAKGYANFADRDYARRHPISEDEMHEARSQTTTLNLDLGDGGNNSG